MACIETTSPFIIIIIIIIIIITYQYCYYTKLLLCLYTWN